MDRTGKGRWIKLLMGTAAVSGIVWIGALAWTLQDYWGGPADAATAAIPRETAAAMPEPSPDDGRFRLLALGDSLTRGTGDPDGKGYVGYLSDELRDKSPEDIAVRNFGVNGLTAPELAGQLKESALQGEIEAADAIVVSIGGNDLFRGGETLGHLDSEYIGQLRNGYLEQLDVILRELRERNAAADIFLIGLYNPFIELSNNAETTAIVRDWNHAAAEVVSRYPNAVLVPTFDLFQLRVQDYLARDQFHPNAEGYRLIGERVASLITWREAES